MVSHYSAATELPASCISSLHRLSQSGNGAGVVAQFVVFRDTVPGSTTLTLTIHKIPEFVTVAAGFLSEETDGQSFAAGAVFYTASVQLSARDHTVRIVGSHTWHAPVHVGMQLILGYSARPAKDDSAAKDRTAEKGATGTAEN